MDKKGLIEAVAARAGLTNAAAGEAVNAVLDAVRDSLAQGDEVRMTGFGTFTVTERAATTGRNPQTGETINIAASKAPRFKPGKALKDGVNG